MSGLGFTLGGVSANISYDKPFNAEVEVARLSKEVNELSEVSATMHTPGWKNICRWAADTVSDYDRQIVSLSSDVDKNKKQIEVRKNLRDMLDSFMRGVNNSVATLPQKQHELEQLTGAAVAPSPQG